MGLSEGGIMAQLFAARHPERVDKLVLADTAAGHQSAAQLEPYMHPDDRPFDLVAFAENFQKLIETWGVDPSFMVDWMMPSQSDNTSFVRWIGKLQRQTATPADIERQISSILNIDAMDALPDITAPTLVMHTRGDRVLNVALGRYLAANITGATCVEIPGDDHFLWVMPNWRDIAKTSIEFITGHPMDTTVERPFGAVLFTDLVDSTARSAWAGDTAWRAMLESHDRICLEVIDQYAGRFVKSTGDGLLAVFDSPSQAVRAAADMLVKLDAIDLGVRAGIHAGEMELRSDGDISGATVNIAARVEQAAGLGELYVSSTVRDMLLGGEHRFAERGDHELKGIEGSWRLYALEV